VNIMPAVWDVGNDNRDIRAAAPTIDVKPGCQARWFAGEVESFIFRPLALLFLGGYRLFRLGRGDRRTASPLFRGLLRYARTFHR
jgi:hypothetical protein